MLNRTLWDRMGMQPQIKISPKAIYLLKMVKTRITELQRKYNEISGVRLLWRVGRSHAGAVQKEC